MTVSVPESVDDRCHEVRWFDTIDSTNRYLLDEAAHADSADDAPDGLVVVARHQTAGRGRRGRVWDSMPGSSLLFSVLCRPNPGESPMHLVWAMSCAVVEMCAQLGGFGADLKWPNDVLFEGRKLAGILAEAESAGGSVRTVVVGCGLNLNWADRFPQSLRHRAVSFDEAAGSSVEPDEALWVILANMERLREAPDLRDRYRANCATLGLPVKVELTNSEVTGQAVRIDDDGALIVVDSQGTDHIITIGDTVHLNPLLPSIVNGSF